MRHAGKPEAPYMRNTSYFMVIGMLSYYEQPIVRLGEIELPTWHSLEKQALRLASDIQAIAARSV